MIKSNSMDMNVLSFKFYLLSQMATLLLINGLLIKIKNISIYLNCKKKYKYSSNENKCKLLDCGI